MVNRPAARMRPVHFHQELVLPLASSYLNAKKDTPLLGETFNFISGKFMGAFTNVVKTFYRQPHIKSTATRVQEFEEIMNHQIENFGTTEMLSSDEAMASLEFIINYLKVVQGFLQDDLAKISRVPDKSHSERVYESNAKIFLPVAHRIFERACSRRNLIENARNGLIEAIGISPISADDGNS